MVDLAHILSHPMVALALRATLGVCLIFMGRIYYADPLASFHGSARPLPFDPWVRKSLRAIAIFCLWGGCFILGAAIAVQIFNFHGVLLALALIALASLATWFLLPQAPTADGRFSLWRLHEPK